MIAEFLALYEAVRDIMHLREYLAFLGIELTSLTIISEDNVTYIAIAQDPTNHKRMRQINTKFFFVRDTIRDKIINMNRTVVELKYFERITEIKTTAAWCSKLL